MKPTVSIELEENLKAHRSLSKYLSYRCTVKLSELEEHSKIHQSLICTSGANAIERCVARLGS